MKQSLSLARTAALLLVIGACARGPEPQAPRIALPKHEGWSSGGGDVIQNEGNPWFLENAARVTYCLIVDESRFGNVRIPPSLAVEHALAYWKTLFARDAKTAPAYDFGRIRIATQTFEQTPCAEETDLRFQFGVLTDEQKEYVKDPRQHIGLSVRTSYDTVQLRAKGFVYIAADGGPLGYDDRNFIPEAWHFGAGHLLEYALVHELGHIFGLPHLIGRPVMSENFLDSILRRDLAPIYANVEPRENPSPFGFQPTSRKILFTTAATTFWHRFLKVSRELSEFELGYENPRGAIGVRGRSAEFHWTDLGRIVLEGTAGQQEDREDAVLVRLTREQKVFPTDDSVSLRWPLVLRGPSFLTLTLSGTFEPRSGGKPSPVALTLFPYPHPEKDFRLSGEIDGKWILDLNQKENP